MCLDTKLSDRSLARYKAKGKKRGYIRVWKVVEDTSQKYKPENTWVRGKLYQTGLNRARKDATDENRLIHAFRNKSSAKLWAFSRQVIVTAMVSPDWVKAIGKTKTKMRVSLTTKAIVMPAYPKRKVTVAEFRAAIKGKKVQTYSWE